MASVLPSMAYNGRDLAWHTGCLVNSVLTEDDLDIPFVKRHLNIGCDPQDIADTRAEALETIRENFLTSQVIKLFETESCITKFRELFGLLDQIFQAPQDDAEKAACILVAKAVSRELFGTLFANIKNDAKRTELEGARKTFLRQLDAKRLAAAEAPEDVPARRSPRKQASPSLDQPAFPAEIIAQIHAAFPYIASLSPQQLREMILYFKGLRVE